MISGQLILLMVVEPTTYNVLKANIWILINAHWNIEPTTYNVLKEKRVF